MSFISSAHHLARLSEHADLGVLPHLDTKLVREIASYIRANRGPDVDGRCHHKLQRLPLAEMEAAIVHIQAQGELEWLRPYHCAPAPTGCWEDQRLVNEVLKKKCDTLIKEEFRGDLTEFCCQVKSGQLLSPLVEMHEGKEISISMGAPGNTFGGSPYAMVRQYLQLIGKEGDYGWFKPYHMSYTPMGTWQDQAAIDEVLGKKCAALVREHFDNDLTRFCCKVTYKQLLSPLEETHAGREISVKMGAIGAKFGSCYEMVQHYLHTLGKSVEYAWFRPYHMSPASQGVWQQQEFIDEVLRKKCDALVRESFDNDLSRFCGEVTQVQLLSPLIETHGGQEISVNMQGVSKALNRCCFDMVRNYIRIVGKESEYAWFRPYHMNQTSMGAYHDQSIVDEVLKKKCDTLLKENFDNDLTRFCCEIEGKHLLSPLIETHAGRDFNVSMKRIFQKFGSYYTIVRHYLEMLGRHHEYDWLQPYHMQDTPQGTWHKQPLIDELLRKKCDSVLQAEFDGDLTAFCCEVTTEQLLSPLVETYGGKEIVISTGVLSAKFSGCRYAIVRHYVSLIGKELDYAWLEPYHMSRAGLGTWQKQEVISAVLRKKCAVLLTEDFGNDLTRFCCEVTYEQLASPLIETHAGREIVVSMTGVLQEFDSLYDMVLDYVRSVGKESEYAWFRPYHMSTAPRGTWQEQSIIDEVLKKKCDTLLKETFNNDLARFCCEVTKKHLTTPLKEIYLGKEILVKMDSVGSAFGDLSSAFTYEVVKHYYRLLGRSFSYTPECFIGSPDTRKRRQSGELSVADLRKIKLPDGTLDTRRYGFKNYTAPDKSAVREFMVEVIEDTLKERSVNYLGLETEQFLSLRALYQRLNLSPEDSLIVEQDRRIFAAMQSCVTRLPNGEGIALRKVELRNNQIEDELELLPERSFQFNVVNLDFLGHMSKSKEYCLQLLLQKRLLDREALVFVTLQDNELARARAAAAGYSSHQLHAVDAQLGRLVSWSGHEVQRLAWLHYGGGSGEKIGSRMLWLAYKVTRKEPELENSHLPQDA